MEIIPWVFCPDEYVCVCVCVCMHDTTQIVIVFVCVHTNKFMWWEKVWLTSSTKQPYLLVLMFGTSLFYLFLSFFKNEVKQFQI
jgi:hypothetical protein